jgi:putative ABC transport system permease protein
MNMIAKLLHRLRALFRKEELDQELSDEMAFHLEKQIEQNIAAGMSAEEARYAALRSFGGVDQIKEECRDAWGVRFIDTLLQDLRFGLRMLAKNPGFTAVAVITLALSIGANSAIFTLVDAAALRPFPVPKPDQLVRLLVKSPQGVSPDFSYADYEDVRQQVKSFSGVAVYRREAPLLNSLDETSQVLTDIVSPDYFTVLGVKPLRGRFFLREVDGNAQIETGVVISYRLWQSRLGSDPAIIGKKVRLTGETTTVIGVAPRHFQGLDRFVPTDMWVPRSDTAAGRSDREFETVARLRDGVSLAEASAELDVLGHRLATAYPETNRGTAFQLNPQTNDYREFLPSSLLLMAVVALVLLIACANLAGLLLARAETRRRELAMRVALGAGRWQLLRQFLTEGFLLSALGGSVGLALTVWLMSFQRALMPPTLSFLGPDMQIDLREVAFTVGITILATLMFSLTPALRAWKVGLAGVLKGGETAIVRRGRRLTARNLLVVGQVALSVMIVTTFLLFYRSLHNLRHLPVGFDTHKNLEVVNVFPFRGAYNAQFFAPLVERVASLPGVKRATYAMRMPLSGSMGGTSASVSIPGFELPEGQSSIPIRLNVVGPNYFLTVGTRIIEGRDFTSADGPESQKVVIVSQFMAHRFWPNGAAVGKVIKIDTKDTLIVGIAEDAKIYHVRESPDPYMYLPFAQSPYRGSAVIVESAGDADMIIPLLRREIHSYSPTLIIDGVDTVTSLMDLSTLDLLMESRLTGILSLMGVFLASIGLYGVVVYIVRSRTREIGIRLALGAELRQVEGFFLFHGIKLALAGVVAGVLGALAAGRLVSGLIYGVKAYDPLCLVASSVAVTVIALFACYIPARRAAKVDPMVALRHE